MHRIKRKKKLTDKYKSIAAKIFTDGRTLQPSTKQKQPLGMIR